MPSADGRRTVACLSEENRAHFGGQEAGVDRDGKDRGVSGYPLVKAVVVMALRSHLVSAACFGPYAVDERQYAKATRAASAGSACTCARCSAAHLPPTVRST